MVWNLVLLHRHLVDAKDSMTQSLYLSAAHHLIEFENVFKEIDTNHQKDVAIVCALRTEFYVKKENIIYDLENIWKQNVIISSNIEGKNKKQVILSLNKGVTGYEEIFKALHLLNYLRPILKEFGKKFLKVICEVLVSNYVKISINEMSSVLTIDVLNEQSPQPNEVFENLKKVFYFMHEELFSLPVRDEDDADLSAMNELGAVISEDFCTLITEKCLKIAIPKQSKQLEAFHKEITAAENFCNDLNFIGFCSKGNNPLLNFIKNVDILPVNKMAQVSC